MARWGKLTITGVVLATMFTAASAGASVVQIDTNQSAPAIVTADTRFEKILDRSAATTQPRTIHSTELSVNRKDDLVTVPLPPALYSGLVTLLSGIAAGAWRKNRR